MHYDALVTKDGENFLIEFPDAPGCQTFAEKSDEVLPLAQEAIEGWLEANLVERRVPPKPERRRAAPMGYSLLRVPVNPVLAVALQVRWERLKRGLSQGDLAALVKVSQQAVAKIEDPDGNPTLDTIQKVAEALDMHVTLSLDALNPFIANATVRSSAEQGIAGKRAVPDVATSRRDARKNRPKQVRRTSPTRR